jgi:tRNA-2-methylthio-N6-dimethylallyladenosine synthase
MTDKVLEVMARYDNICKYIHLPVQSGSSDGAETHEPRLRPGMV